MYLFRIFYSFLPLRNPIGFGASDFVVLAFAILLIVVLIAKAFLTPYFRQISSKTPFCMGLLFGLPILLRIILLQQSPVPVPSGADDFSYLLLGDTLRHLRLANIEHPFHRFFEAVFVLQQPTYSSIYPLGQGLILAFGRLVMQSYWSGVLISSGLLCALCYWMLRAWVAPSLAFAGGLLAIVEFGPLNPWVNSYWGGYVSAIAGCLVFGALPRLAESSRIRNGLLLGTGLGLQILTRPFEAIFLTVAIVVFLAVSFNKGNLTLTRDKRQIMIALGVISLALALTGLQNKAVTNSWTTLPYMLSRYEYGVPATLTFQANATPHRLLTPEQEMDYRAQAAIHGSGNDSIAEYIGRLGFRFRYLRFFVLAPLYFALLAFIPNLRRWRYAWAAGTIFLFALGSNFYPYFFPQYLAALTCLFVLFCVVGLERLGETARSHVLVMCFGSFLFWFGLYLVGDDNLLSVTSYQSWNYINRGDPQGRQTIETQLTNSPGHQLVFIRYSAGHRFEEWIHNDADIDAAQTVWANDLGDEENEKLLGYYPNRKAWLLSPDAHPPALSPYSAESGPFLTVH